MSKTMTAQEQFDRLTTLIPRAARSGSARLDELAREFGISANQLMRDVQELVTRTHYHPAGSVEGIYVGQEQDRVSIWTTGEFHRPRRLSTREALALALGLRILASESDPARREELEALARKLDKELAAAPAEELTPHYGVEDHGGRTGIIAILQEAARERRRCRIEYLKPGLTAPEVRVISPYLLVYAEGNWYTLAHCGERGAVRVFRADRICGIQTLEERFEVPADFDPAEYVGGGRIFRAERDEEVIVRYSPAIARWIVEREGVQPEPDGSVVLRHRVADPRWLVRHVLQYGAEAEVLGPPRYRELIRSSLASILP